MAVPIGLAFGLGLGAIFFFENIVGGTGFVLAGLLMLFTVTGIEP